MKVLLLIFLALLYTLSPVDVLPEIFMGPLGWIEDLAVWILLWYYISSQQTQTDPRNYYQKYQYAEDKTDHTSDEMHTDAKSSAPNDPYAILGVSKNASFQEIKQAYRELASKYHPDKVLHLGEEFKELAEKRFKEINQAYHQLMDK